MTDFYFNLLVVLALLLLLLLTLALFLIYSGVLSLVGVSVGKPYIGNVVIGYKFSRGPYSDSGYVFSESTSLNPEKVQLGIYYDNPDMVPKEKLRWVVAAILSAADGTVDKNAWEAYKAKGYKQFSLPKIDASVNSSFPYVNAISVIAGASRVYPKLNQFVKERKLNAWPYLEIYDQGLINYMGPLSQQRQFLVPEAIETWSEVKLYYPEDADFGEVRDDEAVDTSITEVPVVKDLDGDSDESFEKVEAEI